MKKLLVLAAMVASTMGISAKAQAAHCKVDLVDYRGFTMRTFTASQDYNGTCRDALRDCNREKKVRGAQGVKCKTRRGINRPMPTGAGNYGNGYGNGGYSSGNSGHHGGGHHNGNQNGSGYGNNYGQGTNLLYMTDSQLAEEGMFGIGMCQVERGSWGSSCDLYVKKAGQGYPSGSGCAQSRYTEYYGCSAWSEKENAGCMIRKAIQRGDC